MENKPLSSLSDEELILAHKKMKTNVIINAVLIGVLIGIAVYSTVNNGFGGMTFLPLFFVFFLIKRKNNSEEIENELKSRNLK